MKKLITLSSAAALLVGCADAFVAAPRVALLTPQQQYAYRSKAFNTQRFMVGSMQDMESSIDESDMTEVPSYMENAVAPAENPLDASNFEGLMQRKDWSDVLQVGVGGLVGLALMAQAATMIHVGGDTATLADVASHVPQQLWSSYQEILTSQPIPTKAMTSATVYTIGDVIAQQTEAPDRELDQGRVLRSMLAGLIGHGPMSHFWYNASEGVFNDVLHLTAWWSFIPKIIVDQSLFAPVWNNMYILLLGLMKGESLDTIGGDMKRSTIPLIVSGLKLWPLVHCVTYGLIPVQHRLLWVDAVEILWVTILATQAAAVSEEHEAEALATAQP